MSRCLRVASRAISLTLLLPGLVLSPAAGASDAGTSIGPSHRATATKAARSRHGRSTALASPSECVHVVRRGESLGRIAGRYRVTRAAIMEANHLTAPNALRAGQRLQIPSCQTEVVRAVPPDPAPGDPTAVELVTRVGPRRIPTRLFLSVPAFSREIVGFQWPVEGPIASGFGRRQGGWHAGIDIQAEMGTPIRAVASGTVIFSGWERYYGRFVKIQHQDGFTSLYAHNFENLVEAGDIVETGTVLGTVGRTGRASANHLHFEIRHEETAYNPLHLLQARSAPDPAPDTVAATATANDDEDRE